MDPVVIDAGHGGAEDAGGSTPVGVVGPAGTQEKQVALALAFALCDALRAQGVPAVLTRDGDENPTLRERTFVARSEDARAFISIHLNAGATDSKGCEVWVHERASRESQQLATAIDEELRRVAGAAVPGILAGRLAVLDPLFLPANAPACLVEAGYLTNPNEESRLAQPAYVRTVGEAIARGVMAALGRAGLDRGSLRVHTVEEQFDIWHEVPLVQQLTGMSCWAAAAAMLVGWRDCLDVEPEQVARAAGRWEAYRDGLLPQDVQALAQAWGLVIEPPRHYTVASLRRLLEDNGPLWVGEASPGLHVVVITGMCGDGTPEGTRVRVNDPWPVGRGERYGISFAELTRNLRAVKGLSGVEAQVLHTGGRGGSRASFSRRREVELSIHPAQTAYGTPSGLFARLPGPTTPPLVPLGEEPPGEAEPPERAHLEERSFPPPFSALARLPGGEGQHCQSTFVPRAWLWKSAG